MLLRLCAPGVRDCAVSAGAYGAPTWFITDPATGKTEMFFGSDRFEQVLGGLVPVCVRACVQRS